jgi:hypothetical protein
MNRTQRTFKKKRAGELRMSLDTASRKQSRALGTIATATAHPGAADLIFLQRAPCNPLPPVPRESPARTQIC